MLFEIVLYVQRRMAGRVMVGDGEIVAVMENGRRRTPESTSFNEVVKDIMETDLEPVNPPEQIGSKSHFTTYRHTYRKPGTYIQSRNDRWAVTYPVKDHWMVKRAGEELEARYESVQQARRAVDDWCGTVTDLKELRKDGMVGEYPSAAEIRAKKPQVEEMSALQCYDELDRLATYLSINGRGRNPDAYHVRHVYCPAMKKKVKARLRALGAPRTRPGEKKFYGPGQADWQKGKE